MDVIPKASGDASDATPTLWPFGLWTVGLVVAEWFMPSRWWLLGLLTGGAVAASLWWGMLVGRQLYRAGRLAGASRSSRNWSLLALVMVWTLYVTTQGAKGWLLLDLFHGHDSAELRFAYRNYAVVGLVLSAVGLSLRPRPLQRLLLAVADHTARLVAISFGVTILIGAFLLLLPVSVRSASDISVVNALFMSASAVCVTGLAVCQVAQTYTFFGQIVLLVLVQVGGLGIMVLYGAIVALAGRRMSTRSARMMSEVIDVDSVAGVRRLVLGIVAFTLVVEALGAAGLHASLRPYGDVAMGPAADLPRAGAGSTWWAAVFLSVSAYCNAGFALFRDGIVPFAGDWAVSGIVMLLVIAGGLGFPVWFELLGRVWTRVRRHRPERLSLHGRTVLVVTGLLLVSGTVMYLALEWSRSMRGLPVHAKLLTAAFQSTITRTAGFNSLDYASMSKATWLGTCVLMFIGASPGSTGGGIKTTTFAVLVAATWADLKARGSIEIDRRSVADGAARRAIGVTLISCATVLLVTFVLLILEPFEPLRLGFEAVSALATVGLSTGITSELSSGGKVVVTLAMYLGRIGPLTLALAMASTPSRQVVSYPVERIGIG